MQTEAEAPVTEPLVGGRSRAQGVARRYGAA